MRVITQRLRQQAAAVTVHLDVSGVAQHQALEALDRLLQRGQGLYVLLDALPVGQRIDDEAFRLRVDGHHDLAVTEGTQWLALARWHGQSPLGVHIDVLYPAKHASFPRLSGPSKPQKTRYIHFFPLFDTIGAQQLECQASQSRKTF